MKTEETSVISQVNRIGRWSAGSRLHI